MLPVWSLLGNRNGNRAQATLGGVTTYYIGNHFEWRGSTSTMTRYYYADGQRVAMRVGSNAPSYLLGDHLGSTSVTATSTGAKYAEQRYYPWGGTRWPDNPLTPTARRYTGQIEDAAIGLYFYNARYYDPALGRFLQADTIVPSPQNPQSFNRYAYTLNNPIKYTDPSGHCVFGVDTAICVAALIGGGVNLAVDYFITTQVLQEEYSIGQGVIAFGTGALGTLIGGAVIPQIAQGIGSAVMVKVAATTANRTASVLAGAATQVASDIALSSLNNVVMGSVQRVGKGWVDGGHVTRQTIADDLAQHAKSDAIFGGASSLLGQTFGLLSGAYLPNPLGGGDVMFTPGKSELMPLVRSFSDGLTRSEQRALAIRSGYQIFGQTISDTATLELMNTLLQNHPRPSPVAY